MPAYIDCIAYIGASFGVLDIFRSGFTLQILGLAAGVGVGGIREMDEG